MNATLGKRQALEQETQPTSVKRIKVTEFESKEKQPSVNVTLVFNTYPNRVKTELEKLGCKLVYLQSTRKQTASQSYLFEFACEAVEDWTEERLLEEISRQTAPYFDLKDGVY